MWCHLKRRNLRGSATQKGLLFVNLPLMIGAVVPKKYFYWKTFLILQQIFRIGFSCTVSNNDLMELDSLMSCFLKSFKKYFKRKIFFKMHNLVHYPRYISELGPLCTVWCMRFDGKHAFFKSLQNRTRNFKKLPLYYCFSLSRMNV